MAISSIGIATPCGLAMTTKRSVYHQVSSDEHQEVLDFLYEKV